MSKSFLYDLPWQLKDLPAPDATAPTVLSTFASGGGSTMGYKLAGFNVIAANDIDPEMAQNYKHNFDPKHYFLMPIRDLVQLAKNKSLPAELYDLDVIDGSPPCSSFSTSGLRDKTWGKEKHFREGQSAQVLDDLFFDYLDLIETLKPKVSIAENVTGMLIGSARGYVSAIIDRYKKIGYRVQLFQLNAADCGVPQKRVRIFFVAVRNDYANKHSLDALCLAPKSRWRTVRHAFNNLPTLTFLNEDKTQDNSNDKKLLIPTTRGINLKSQRTGEVHKVCARQLWEVCKPGQNFSQVLTANSYKASHFNWIRFDFTQPAPTIMAEGRRGMMHPFEPRRITCAETFRLSSFPDDYEATTSAIGKYLAGMSVPPFMTRTVASAVRDQWLQHRTKNNT